MSSFPPSPKMTEQVEVHQNVSNTLTPLRIIRGLICLVIYISTAFMFIVYFVPAVAVFLRLLSVHYSRKSVCFLFGLWLGLWPFLFEKINRTKVIFSGENVPKGERVLLISNHRTEVDWMYPWDLAMRKGCLGSIKYVLKNSLMKLPIFGWGFHILEFIPVERKWDVDEPILRQMLATFTDRQDPLWLTVFPEGTDFTEEKSKRSQKFAAENGLPVLKHVLLPKKKGFQVCLEALRCSLDAVYDLTIAYKNRCPSFIDNVFGTEPSEVHIHVRRIPVEKIPSPEEESNSWLMDTFQFKDKLLSDFATHGHFPNEGTEGELSTMKCLLNFAAVIIITGIFSYLTFFSSVWFKVYVALVCAFLGFSTYLGIKPFPSSGSGKIYPSVKKTE